jgi:hypothetical protein
MSEHQGRDVTVTLSLVNNTVFAGRKSWSTLWRFGMTSCLGQGVRAQIPTEPRRNAVVQETTLASFLSFHLPL